MISIGRHLDEYDIAQEIRFERKVHKGAFLILEGSTDIKRFQPFVDEKKCSIINGYGRLNAIGAIKLLYEDGFPGVVAVVDADFDRVTRTLEEHEGLIYSETHDFDLDWARPRVVARYLAEVGEKSKCELHGDVDAIIKKILEGLKPVSVAKLLSITNRIRYRLADIDASKVFANFRINLDAYIELVFEGRTPDAGEKGALRDQVSALCRREYDLSQLTNGHDFHCALGACLRVELGSRRHAHSWGSEVEKDLRLAFSDQEFKATAVYQMLSAWASDNHPYVVLDSRLSS